MNFPDACLHELFDQQVERTPQHTAVIMKDVRLTYEELQRQSNRFGHYLIQKGTTPDMPVGVCMNRSLELIVVLLGILKAGGAYVPLDTEAPCSRNERILKDVGARICVTERDAWPDAPCIAAEVLVYPTLSAELMRLPDSTPRSGVQPGHLVSVYYTSGSTGKPKGVANMHQGWASAIQSMQHALQLQPGETILQKTTLTFDDAALEIFWPLLTGGRVALLDPGLHRDPEAMIDAAIRYDVAFLVLVSSMLGRILDVVTPEQAQRMTHLRGCFGGGEALPAPLGRRYRQHKLPGALYNLWGATEVSIGSTLHRCTEKDFAVDGQISIGQPFINSRVYILDQSLQKVAVGVTGDLYVAGKGVARGYIHDPERTRTCFTEDPFVPGERMYRTGDQAYFHEDGSIQFVGRSDHQVKIRGIRVELGEIEAALAADADIKEAAVVLREDIPSIQRLTGYVVLYPERPKTPGQIKAQLQQRLPAYMIPHDIMLLDELPLNSNSKLDRLALPVPVPVHRDTQADRAPHTPLEVFLAETFADVLQFEQVGRTDDFFEMGGDSISASRVISVLRSCMDAALPLTLIFDKRNVKDLAQHLAARGYRGESLHRRPLFAPNKPDVQAAEMSFAQERLWFVQQMDPHDPVYNEPLAYRIEGRLDIQALRSALSELVKRHEALRTTFTIINDQPAPRIADRLALHVPVIHLATERGDDPEALVQRRLTEEARKPFDLEQGPLIRTVLFSLNEENWILFINMHHIITDAWSNVIFLEELNLLYTAYSRNRPNPLLELPFPYSDYASWHKDWVQRDGLQEQLAFWKNELSGELPMLPLPTDYPRPSVQTYEGDKLHFTLSAAWMSRIQGLSRFAEASVYMILQAAFRILLHRYSGQQDIIVGSPIANRNHYGLDKIMGCFVNTVAIRSQFQGNDSFLAYLQQVKARCLTVYEHQDFPFEFVVRELQPHRNHAYAPIVQVMFAYQNKLEELLELGDLAVHSIDVNSKTSRYDLTLFCKETAAGHLSGTFEFNTRLFRKATIERMLGSFTALLDAMLSQPEQIIAKLPLLPLDEQQRILFAWNDTFAAFPSELCLHELFERQVQETPKLIAAVYQGQEMTYEELEQRSNQLAHHLLLHNRGEKNVVGVCVDRSLELVISLMAILKAGAAFVPIDMELPPNRMYHILQDADVKVCLAQKHVRQKLMPDGVSLVCLDSDGDRIGRYPSSRPERSATAASPVSIYYTSGSTGKPKGVINLHRGWVNRMCWMQKHVQLKPGETVLQKTTLTFDDAAVELFWTLMCGGRVALLEPGLHRDPRSIIQACIQYEAVHVQFVPSMLNLVLDEITPEDLRQLHKLRSTISSGEALTANLVTRGFAKLPGTLTNTWGATEVSIDSTFHVAAWEDMEAEGAVCIGRPIDNNRCYVLDEYLQPVPPGVTGNLYVAGVGLAQGYLNLPERTAQAFIPDPFIPEERMYRTGDLGFYRSDGSLQFMGRADHQVKIRGMRVELGEIEAILLQHGNVKEAVVIVDEDTPSVKRLVAYVVPLKSGTKLSEELRQLAKDMLPEYMVPSFILLLERMPLTAHGKVDRSQLVKPERIQHDTAASFVQPQTQMEEYLAGIWRELLNMEHIGIQDHFFDLGGHSLLATQIVSRIRRQLELEVPLRDVLLYPTIQQLASKVEELLYEKMEQMSDEEVEALLKS
ncbi:non-ribosomal peptide synthetase [Paenibacillus popilliae]|uniref:Non-ribosomal peptide synthetase module n=1 Tax=Paenibacillus popilliae ATCC 14706 TaxID=1212764 RepID=M9LDL1_PAEPP|nr:non-ribosomal peptide synthetase [Paenibacillus popilliae]GAC44492.1 non-ribosomal peptide synthetase module [Paenibacillus popilliae ATCC 14706]